MNTPTKPPAFLFSTICVNASPSNHARPMLIIIDNGLPTITMRFGISDEQEISFNVHIDACA